MPVFQVGDEIEPHHEDTPWQPIVVYIGSQRG